MEKISLQLTVYFECPFWVGVFETRHQQQLQVSRVVFGKEPMNEDILQVIYKQLNHLKQSPGIAVVSKQKQVSPKRLQRDVKKQMQKQGIGTQSQIALKMQYEITKQEHFQQRKKDKEIKKQEQYDMKQQKKKEKHRGH